MAVEDVNSLWRKYRASRDQQLRDRLILTYAPLVKFVAGRLGSGCLPTWTKATWYRYGLLGLIGAIERYDPDRDVKFETYAIARIKGSIIDELRAMDWVPRSVRARARDIERAIGELGGAKRRRADRGGDRRQAGRQPVTSSTRTCSRSRAPRSPRSTSSGRSPRAAATRSPDRHDRGYAGAGDRRRRWRRPRCASALGEAIARLPEREKLVVTLYYYEELTLREIGEVLGVTESRVSQLHTKAILRLKARLGGAQTRAALERG